ncbi:MAG: hypothetical protein OWQ54_03700 [Sulfolobaceae archaeon]|nr:hypothetical protein [Sulfolobaceae archaeon]
MASNGIAVDINMAEIVVSKGDNKYVRILIRIEDYYKILAENIQKIYNRRLKENKKIRAFYKGTKKSWRILLGKRIVEVVKLLDVSTIFLKDLSNTIKSVKNLSKGFRDMLCLIQYRRI